MKSSSLKWSIIKSALYSRLLIIILQYIFNHSITDHDAGVFLYPKEKQPELVGDKIVQHLFGGFLRWDAQYFMHLAKYGYTYENTVAFFPLFPLLGTVISKCLHIPDIMNIDSLILIVFIIMNTVFFVFTAVTLFDLSSKIFSVRFSYYSSLLFCWNPASIFFSAPYTECLFSFLTFKSMLNCTLLYEKYRNLRGRIVIQDIFYLLPISLSGITRSNGLLNIGFCLYVLACIFLQNYIQIKGNIFSLITKRISLILAFAIITIFCIIFCVVPFDIFQMYCYKLFCSDFVVDIPVVVDQYAKYNNLVVFGTFSQHNQSWCNDKLPLAYSYVQKQYWNVGFLNYYELKQIPNFILAGPILTIFLYVCLKYFCQIPQKSFLDLFYFDTTMVKSRTIFGNPLLFVFVVHGLFLSIFCIFFMHIQVSTRFLCSASPLLYWFSAYHLVVNGNFCDIREFKVFTFWQKFILLFYFIYFIVGTALFCNFLPWT